MQRAILLVLLLHALSGCGGMMVRQAQMQVADGIGQGANAALGPLLTLYKTAGDNVIAQAKTREEAEAGIAVVKAEWAVRWKAWATLALAQDTYSTALEQGLDLEGGLNLMRNAYCGLAAVWPKAIPLTPLVPVLCQLPPAPPSPAEQGRTVGPHALPGGT